MMTSLQLEQEDRSVAEVQEVPKEITLYNCLDLFTEMERLGACVHACVCVYVCVFLHVYIMYVCILTETVCVSFCVCLTSPSLSLWLSLSLSLPLSPSLSLSLPLSLSTHRPQVRMMNGFVRSARRWSRQPNNLTSGNCLACWSYTSRDSPTIGESDWSKSRLVGGV